LAYKYFSGGLVVKRILALCVIVLLFTGCNERNQYGKCIGIGEDRDPKLSYKVDGWNFAMGIIFFELIIPPSIVLTDEFYCPSGVKQQ
jgi:hypothetical protein